MKKKLKSSTPQPEVREVPWRRWGYISGMALIVLGILILSVALGVVLRATTRSVYPVKLPCTQLLDMKKEGMYMGVYQHKGEFPLPVQSLSSLNISLIGDESREPIPVHRGQGAQVLDIAGRQGALLFMWEIPFPGKYLLSAAYPSGKEGPAFNVLIVHETVQQNRADFFVGLFICLVLCGLGTYVLIRTRKAGVPKVK